MSGLGVIWGILVLYLWREDLADWVVDIGIRIKTDDSEKIETDRAKALEEQIKKEGKEK